MDEDQKKKIALFRFGIISPLIGAKSQGWGYQKKLLQEICDKQWEIPSSGRSNISKSTILNWLSRYEKSGNSLDALMPSSRKDIGLSRKLDKESILALVNMKLESPNASVSVLIDIARSKGILPLDSKISNASVYRILKKHILLDTTSGKDRRKFEAERPNELWQADCMHGPYVVFDGKKRKTFLFAIIDDHSRLITNARFYLQENLTCFLECIKTALCKRGLPRKLYVDNGPYFKAHRLEYSLAHLGVALMHSKPYSPQGKGKIERWFRTVRMCFLPKLSTGLTLNKLNELLEEWVSSYNDRKHSSTNLPPLKRYLDGIDLIKQAPNDIESYFRTRVSRRVNNDRSVSLKSMLFEAPIGLVGKKIEVVFNEADPLNVEAFFNGKSWGNLTVLDQQINSKVYREGSKKQNNEPNISVHDSEPPKAGKLFESGVKDD